MKNSILFTLIVSLFFAITSPAVILQKPHMQQTEQLCRIMDEKVNHFQMHMQDNEYSMKTLASYQRQADQYCNQYFEEALNCIK